MAEVGSADEGKGLSQRPRGSRRSAAAIRTALGPEVLVWHFGLGRAVDGRAPLGDGCEERSEHLLPCESHEQAFGIQLSRVSRSALEGRS